PTAKILRGPGRLLRRVQYAFDRCSVRSVGLGHIVHRAQTLLHFCAKGPHSGTERARRTGRFARSLDELADVGCDTRLSLEASSHPDLLSFALLLEQVLAVLRRVRTPVAVGVLHAELERVVRTAADPGRSVALVAGA